MGALCRKSRFTCAGTHRSALAPLTGERAVVDKRNKRRKRNAAASSRAREPEPDITNEELWERLDKYAWQRRLAWMDRPQVHTAAFEDQQPGAKRARKQEELAKKLDWSDERLSLFKQLVVAYRKDSSIENYLLIRHEFPEVEIQVGRFGGLEALFKLEKEFARQGIDPRLVAGSLDADESSIDALCLCLLELLVARGKLPKSGAGYIEKRRNAISDPTINYLIVEMLEAADWHGESIRVPASLVVLIREQLCGSNPDLRQMYLSRERFQNAAIAAGQISFQINKQISVRKLATMVGVGRGTAARWLADKEFQRWFDLGRDITAGKVLRLKDKL
jgi:hypothetical protein